jgi:hypothetical protein
MGKIAYERVKGFIPREFDSVGFDLYVPFATNEDVMFGIMRDYYVRSVTIADSNVDIIKRLQVMSKYGNVLLSELSAVGYEFIKAGDHKTYYNSLQTFLTSGEKRTDEREVAVKMLLSHFSADGNPMSEFSFDKGMPFYDSEQMKERIELLGDVCAYITCADFDTVVPNEPKDALFFIQRPEDMAMPDKIRLSAYKSRIEKSGAKIIHYY